MEITVLLNKKGFTPLEKAVDGAGDERLMNSVRRGGSLTGFTLIEVIVALLVLLLVFLALMQTALVGIESNMKNVLRDEAVSIAEERMNEARNLLFTGTVDTLDPDNDDGSLTGADCPTGFGTSGRLIERNIRNVASHDFCTNRGVTPVGTDNRQVTITIGWRWKGENYTHSIMTMMRRQ